MVLVCRVVAQDVHIHAGALLDHGQADPAGANDGHSLPSDFISQKGKERMPCTPTFFAYEFFARPKLTCDCAHHEEREFCCSFRENVRSVGEWDFVAVRVGTINVVETDCDLCDHFQLTFTCFKNFCVNGIAQSSDQTVNSVSYFLKD